MKKALLLLAIATMATNLMAAGDPGNGEEAKADVTVRAEIISDNLKITDVYGKPLVLDLGQAFFGEATTLFNEVEYKVSAKNAVTKDINLTMALGTNSLDIYNTTAGIDPTQAGADEKLKVTLNLDNTTKVIKSNKKEARGTISGSTVTTTTSKGGVYVNKVLLTATVQ